MLKAQLVEKVKELEIENARLRSLLFADKSAKSVGSAGDIVHSNKLCERFALEKQEHFMALLLDNKHKIIEEVLITKGTLNQSLVHPRETFARAIEVRAAAIILVHNHPSGEPTPSNQDVIITNRLKDVGELVGIKVLDHIIIGGSDFFSFFDNDAL